MFSFDGAGFSDVYAGDISRMALATLLLACVVATFGGAREYRPAIFLLPVRARPAAVTWLVFPLFVLAMLKLCAQSYSPFLYFQF